MTRDNKTCWLFDGGLIPFARAFDLQRGLVDARKAGAIPDLLFLCEHPHVITQGRNGKSEHLRASQGVLAQMKVQFEFTDRGGDITYHGPGQVIGYPILDLADHRRDVRWYVDQLEEVMIGATADFGILARRLEGCHGVWVDTPSGEEKLGALGVHLSRWVTSHGFAYNVSTDLRYFDLIVPCGIAGKHVTSLDCVLGGRGATLVTIEEARARLTARFGQVFDRRLTAVSREKLDGALACCRAPHASLLRQVEFSPDAEKAVAAGPELAEY